MAQTLQTSPRKKGVIDLETLKRAFPEPTLIATQDPLVAHKMAGRNTRLIVSFSSIGIYKERDKIPGPEFVGSASDYGENHVLFFTDASRSWMNGANIVPQVLKIIEDYVAAHQITELVAIGYSMGGFSAIILAELMSVNIVLSFAPQFSARAGGVPADARWEGWRHAITDWKFADVGNMARDGTTYYIVHGDRGADLAHLRKFPTGRRIHHYVVRNAGHNVVRLLQKRRRLKVLTQHALQNRPRRFRIALERSFGHRFQAMQRSAYNDAEAAKRAAP